MATIKAIEGRTVHQIQSGQVIVDLCSVVKELVENSLDAGATSIDVRFKNQGLDAIEVQDNGDGISPANYETLALKHHTSKLSTYSDLTTLQTFGFRGEALSSLCALSKFTVVTCMAQNAPKGTKLEFEVSGKLKGTSVVAAQKGTVVSVENLFNTLPVRRGELERNIKREWNRVTGVLGQYACIQTGIKFSVSQQAGKGKKTTLFSTKGNQSTRENIVNVFGAKTLTALVPLDLNFELEATSAPSQRWSTQDDGGKKDIRIVGHISRPARGEGRQTPDRQMFFVNSRPCGLPQVAKAFNEVYKAYNASQSPFIFANIELDTHLYDVNVSPDKRTILLHDQNRMLENLKIRLTELFESQDYTVPISQIPAPKQPSYKQLTIARANTAATSSSRATPAPRAPSESTEGNASEDEAASRASSKSGSKASRREQSADDEEAYIKKYGAKPGHPAISRDSMNKATEGVSLISNWVGRKAGDREEPKDNDASAKPAVSVPGGLPDEKRRLVEKLRKEGEAREQPAEDSRSGTESSIITTQSTDTQGFHHSLIPPVLAFQERLSKEADSASPEAEDESSPVQPEEPIPILASPATSPAKPQSSIAERFSRNASTQRPASQIATITIGDHTITSSIGTPCPKRARTDASSTWRGNASSQSAAKAGPSFGSVLSQRFAAPGTVKQQLSASEEGTEDEDEEETQDPLPTPQLVESDPEDSMDTNEFHDPETSTQEADHDAHPPQSVTIKDEDDLDDSVIPPEVGEDIEYISETQKKTLEEAKIQEMIRQVETAATIPSQENSHRTKSLLKGGSKKKDATANLVQTIATSPSTIAERIQGLQEKLASFEQLSSEKADDEGIDATQAEEKLSLTISKADFSKMRIIGQFNLGFILATRTSKAVDSDIDGDDLFIIDQHASDEKYNFERLQATTIVQSQRLVQPKTLDLTAMEEEIVIENLSALEQNGFVVTADQSGESPVGRRCQLVSLPLSKEKVFDLNDLEELIALLADHPPGSVPRPSKVRKMFAMRACRSSIMIGRDLTHKQMSRVVNHLGELDKPWNCPHGRPTMRHLCGLGVWDGAVWKEGDDADNRDENESSDTTDWAAYVRQRESPEDVPLDDDIEDSSEE